MKRAPAKLFDETATRARTVFAASAGRVARTELASDLPGAVGASALDDLGVPALHNLERATISLRHAPMFIVPLKTIELTAETAAETGQPPSTRDEFAEAVSNLASVEAELGRYWGIELSAGATIGSVFPVEKRQVAEALIRLTRLCANPGAGDCADIVSTVRDIIGTPRRVAEMVSARRFSPADVCREIASLFKAESAAKNIEMIVGDSADGAAIHGNRPRLRDAVGECVRNALRHGFAASQEHKPRRITMKIEWDAPDQRAVRLVIADTGLGIPRDRLEAIGVARGAPSGAGEGLSLARRVVEQQHAGRMTVRSGADGTEVSMIFPVRLES